MTAGDCKERQSPCKHERAMHAAGSAQRQRRLMLCAWQAARMALAVTAARRTHRRALALTVRAPFATLPHALTRAEGYKPPDEGPAEYQTIPLSKIEDFGVHAKQVRIACTRIPCCCPTGPASWLSTARLACCIDTQSQLLCAHPL